MALSPRARTETDQALIDELSGRVVAAYRDSARLLLPRAPTSLTASPQIFLPSFVASNASRFLDDAWIDTANLFRYLRANRLLPVGFDGAPEPAATSPQRTPEEEAVIDGVSRRSLLAYRESVRVLFYCVHSCLIACRFTDLYSFLKTRPCS
jgi:hypothetical protein